MNRYAFAIAVAGIATMQFDTAHAQQSSLAGMAAMHAAANGVPVSLVHRVIMRESRYNPRAVSRGNYGIMQIRLGTARSMGYSGSAAGLLDANTNMTYAVRYLARGTAAAAFEAGQKERIVISEFESVETAIAAHNCPAYQDALKALGNGAVRDLRIVEGLE